MNAKGALYRVAMLAWVGLAFGAWLYVDLGYAEPGLSFADVPGGSTGAFAGAMGVAVVGLLIIGSLDARRKRGEWRDVGRRVGLEPAEDPGDRSGPELTGSVGGRTVTASYDERSVSSGGRGSKRVTFTVAEAELADSAEEGVVVGRSGESLSAGVGTLDFDDMAATVSATEGLVALETGDLVLVGTSTAAVEAVAAGASGEAVRAVRDLEIAAVGDASGVVARWAEARNEELEGSVAEFPVDNLVDRVPGDAGTVTVETRASMRDGDVLGRFLEGTVAVADAFEAATARRPPSE